MAWILLSITSIIGQACNPFSGAVNKEISNNYYYAKADSQIRYSPGGNWFELGNSKVDADPQTFIPLSSDFAKDKNHIFYKDIIIDDEVHVASFKAVNHFALDKDHVYIPVDKIAYSVQDTLPRTKKMFVLEGADPETYYETDDWNWSKDAKNWFYHYKKIDVDYASFTPMNDSFCKDDYTVYLRTYFDLIPCEIDPQTFKILNNRYAADSNNIYDFVAWADGEKVNQLNKFSYKHKESIKFLNDDYLLFDNSVIYEGLLIKGANPSYFKVLESPSKAYAIDDAHVFCNGKIIVDADIKTFKLYDNDQYSSDKNWVYYFGKKIEGADVETFGPKDHDKWIYRDKNHIYVGDKIRDNYPN